MVKEALLNKRKQTATTKTSQSSENKLLMETDDYSDFMSSLCHHSEMERDEALCTL